MTFKEEITHFQTENSLTNKSAAQYLNISLKTLTNWKKGKIRPGQARMEKIKRMINNYPLGDKPVPEYSIDKIIRLGDERLLHIAIHSLLNCAYNLAIHGAEAALLASFQPHITLTPGLHPIHKDIHDRLYPEDYFASQAIKNELKKYTEQKNHVLSYGLKVYDEEIGFYEIDGINNSEENPVNRNLIIFIDPLDGSSFWCEQRRIFGGTIVTFYHIDLGFLCSVCVDISGKRAYQKMRGIPAYCNSLFIKHDPADSRNSANLRFERGSHLPLINSGVTKPSKNTAINIYRATPERDRMSRELIDKLDYSFSPEYIFSLPGTAALCLTASGAFSACIELGKGYRPWDFVGTFICSDNCFVCDENGNEIDFNEYRIKKEYIRSGFAGKHMKECRQKFIVAATKELGTKLLEIIQS